MATKRTLANPISIRCNFIAHSFDQKLGYFLMFAQINSCSVPEQQNSETDLEPTHVAVETAAEEVAMGTVETKDSVVTNDVVEDDKSQTNQPMDLGSPLDSDPEFDLLSGELDESVDAATKEEEESVCGTEDTQQTVEKEKEEEHSEEAVVKAEEEEEREGEKEIDADVKMKKEDEDSKDLDGGERRMERLDSTFDSSYEPATEELLYEGDPETEPKQDTSQEVPTTEDLASSREEEGGGEKMADTSASEKREEEEGFMVEVHYKDQGGILEDPAATVIGPASSSRSNSGEKAGKAGKPSGVAGGKTTGESNRFVLQCRFSLPLSFHSIVLQLECTVCSNWSTPCCVLIGAHHVVF